MRSTLLEHISIEPGKRGERPAFAVSVFRVSDILELLSAGASYDEILADHPFLEREDILAAWSMPLARRTISFFRSREVSRGQPVTDGAGPTPECTRV